MMRRPLGLLVMAYGGPQSVDDLPGYLADIRRGRPTPRAVVDEIAHNFRNEGISHKHSPEFTMLEWYREGWDHLRLMDEVAEVVAASLALVGRSAGVVRIAYRELYRARLGLDPFTVSVDALRAPLAEFGIDPNRLGITPLNTTEVAQFYVDLLRPVVDVVVDQRVADREAIAATRGSGA